MAYGIDDDPARNKSRSRLAHLQRRLAWVDAHMPWRNQKDATPAGWDPVVQLKQVGVDLGSSFPVWLATLPPPVTMEYLPQWHQLAAGHLEQLGDAPVVAIEALWDGDTTGWMVCLDAILKQPSHLHPQYTEKSLVILRGEGGDLRLFNGTAPPWPEARIASEIGHALAESRGVPFHFGSPEQPDDQAMRWWDTT
jgi:hypothetical protein